MGYPKESNITWTTELQAEALRCTAFFKFGFVEHGHSGTKRYVMTYLKTEGHGNPSYITVFNAGKNDKWEGQTAAMDAWIHMRGECLKDILEHLKSEMGARKATVEIRQNAISLTNNAIGFNEIYGRLKGIPEYSGFYCGMDHYVI